MEKDLKIGLLLDFYGNLLTDAQKNILALYFNEDCSLSEIAQVVGLTRQGVLDAIKRGGNKLLDIETNLKIFEKYSQTAELLKLMEERGSEEMSSLAKNIRQIWED